LSPPAGGSATSTPANSSEPPAVPHPWAVGRAAHADIIATTGAQRQGTTADGVYFDNSVLKTAYQATRTAAERDTTDFQNPGRWRTVEHQGEASR
jgi:hypothetical protein